MSLPLALIEVDSPNIFSTMACSGPITLMAKNIKNETVVASKSQTIDLSTSDAGTFYDDSNCSNPITSTSIQKGSSNKQIYFISSTPGDQLITFTSDIIAINKSIFTNAVVKVSAGSTHTCALMNDGTIKCWGLNNTGQLGDGTLLDRLIPTTVAGISNATDVIAGHNHTCAVLTDKTIKCWGQNSTGQLGNGTTVSSLSPVTVLGISNATNVSVFPTGDHMCATLEDHTAKCWGYNNVYQIGDGTSITRPTPIDTGFTNIKKIVASDKHTCILFLAGNVKCVGYGKSGALGDGLSSTTSSTWVDVTGISTGTDIYTGFESTCVKLSNTSLQCWGNNGYAKLGTGGNLRPSPVTINTGNGEVLDHAGGGVHTCALFPDKTVSCSGANYAGQFAQYTEITRNVLSPIVGLNNIIQMSAGIDHTCGVTTAGTIQCWGKNTNGQLGNNLTTIKLTPIQIPVGNNVMNVMAGQYHMCAGFYDGTVACSGWNQTHQLGNGAAYVNSQTHTPVLGLTNVSALSDKGVSHTCAIITGGTIKCWGYNTQGQLGNNSTVIPNTPVSVIGITNAVKVANNTYSTCAVLADETIQCWGTGTNGQLGNGSSSDSLTPVTVSNINNAIDIVASSGAFCALLDTGAVQCWGPGNYGQLGNNSSSDSNIPVNVSTIDGVTNLATSIGAGGNHFCAVISGGTIKCWGLGTGGQLGQGTGNSSLTPVNVVGITNAVEVTGFNSSTCARLNDGTAKCWGINYFGQLGNNSTVNNYAPVAVSGLTNITKITASLNSGYACAIKSDKTLWCWGTNDSSQLGLGANDPLYGIYSVTHLFD